MIDSREAAVRGLAERLSRYRSGRNVVVVGPSPGGAVLAAGIARELHVAFDIFPVRQLYLPSRPECALGLLAGAGITQIDEAAVRHHGVSKDAVAVRVAAERKALRQQEFECRGPRPAVPLAGATVILVDEGVVTGATLNAAVSTISALRPASLVIAVPVAPVGVAECVEARSDEFICLQQVFDPTPIRYLYRDLPPVSAADVRALYPHDEADAACTPARCGDARRLQQA